MRFLLVFLFSLLSYSMLCQNFGIRVGVTTATPTGNNDAYDFDFLESFSLGYQGSVFGNFELSDVIILKPQLSYREYTVKQEIDWGTNTYNVEQTHNTFGADLNFDVELTNSISIIFGMGMDYIMGIQIGTYVNQFEEITQLDLSDMSNDQRMDPFANVGVCFKIGRVLLLDVEYRHLLDNWGTGNLVTGSQLLSGENGSVKLHMINLSAAILF